MFYYRLFSRAVSFGGEEKRLMLVWLRGYETLLWWLGAMSVLMFVGTLVALPLVVVRLPTDYFRRDPHHATRHLKRSAALRLLGLLGKNLLGIVFVCMGVAMLVLPGQGILTILIGLMLMNFPGKRALEQRLVQQPTVLRAMNWMRSKAHQPALELPTSACPSPADTEER
jgi:putative transmembrane protein PGPGW